ncbi:MAG TPA: Hsp20/alpha crystallin family protein [Casimicrobiaceae bacterium]|nr:Hsp20/alpha crystallin family protein [Casimicrobiaceae bacterium]
MTNLVSYYSPLDRMFDRAFGALLPAVNGDAGGSSGALRLDVMETPEAYVVKADAPGVAKDKIEVKVDDRDVTIGVEFREAVESNGKALWTERRYGKATRSIRLPEAVDANAAEAKHVDGVLQLTLPKLVKANRRQITIQ